MRAVAIVGLVALTALGTAWGCAAKRGREAAEQALKASDLTDPEEHYLGRAVTATFLTKYKPIGSEKLNGYVSLVGTAVALASDRPETFGGWRFQVVSGEDSRVMGIPGGFVLITEKRLRECTSEDELAAALAPAIGRVVRGDTLPQMEVKDLEEGVKVSSERILTGLFPEANEEGAEAVLRAGYDPMGKAPERVARFRAALAGS